MKSVAAVLISLAASALGQSAYIGKPLEGESFPAGSNIIVQVQRPNSLTGSQEMAVAIGMQSCVEYECHSVDAVLGQVLYNGPFAPVYHETALPPYENFSIVVPSTFEPGPAVIGVAHATLIGAGPWPFLETLNRTINIV